MIGQFSRSAALTLIALVFVSTLDCAHAAETPPDATTLVEHNRVATLLPFSSGHYDFVLIDASGTKRTRRVYSETKLEPGTQDNRRLSRFEYPPEAEGIASLLIEHSHGVDDLWVYLPGLKKVRRIIADNKKDSFMGTDLSYGDVIGYPVAQWHHVITGDDVIDGRACWWVESKPVDNNVAQTSGYSVRRSCIDQQSYVALRTDVVDLAGKPLKEVTASDIRPAPGQPGMYVTYRIDAVNLQTGHHTIITVDQLDTTDVPPNTDFTPAALEDAE